MWTTLGRLSGCEPVRRLKGNRSKIGNKNSCNGVSFQIRLSFSASLSRGHWCGWKNYRVLKNSRELRGILLGKVDVSMLRSRISRVPELAFGLSLICGLGAALIQPPRTLAAAQATAAPKAPPAVGTIKSISATTITLTTDAGTEIKVTLQGEVKYLRVPPGSKDLKEAVAIQFSDLQEGDRILVRGKPGEDAGSFLASTVIAMKKGDIAEKQAHEREEWQRRGIGGLVKSTDPSVGVVTIGTMTQAGSKDVEVHIAKTTIVRRYAPGSVKFDDAKASSLAEIRAGDQLRARGTRSEDGANFTADEIVSGAFRNIAGTIGSIDASTGTLTVADLASNKPVEIKITADSQMRKLPQSMAQRIAMRLKGISPEADVATGATAAGGAARPGATASGGASGAPAGPPLGLGAQGGQGWSGGGMGGPPRNGGGDLQQMLSRLPVSPLSDFQKGDAVMIVATTGQNDSRVVAITVLGGVEPILQASPQGQAASILTPWSLNSGGSDAGTP